MKIFTLDEAQSLLPVLESLLKRAIEGKQSAEEAESHLAGLAQRIYLSGGMRVNPVTVAKQRAELESHMNQVKESVAEIDAIGVQVKDIDSGLLDFPFKLDDEVVLLCWRMGETVIEHWHTVESGFSGRQPVWTIASAASRGSGHQAGIDANSANSANAANSASISPMYIPEHVVRAVLTYELLIPAIRQALIEYSAGNVVQPARTVIRAGNAEGHANGWFAVMPVVAGDVMAVKTVTFYPDNAELGLPTHMAMIELLSRATGQPLAVMDGRLITEMRTAAVSAVALEALAPPNVSSLGILGSGVQARSHLEALRLIRPSLKEVRVWSRTPANAEKLAEEAGARAVSIEGAAAADVVLVATSSPTPILEGRWLKRDGLVIAVGAIGPHLRELDDETMLSSCVIAEARGPVESESGDVRLSGASVHAEIGQILAGAAQVPAGGRIVFQISRDGH